jgi:hypothetical protein
MGLMLPEGRADPARTERVLTSLFVDTASSSDALSTKSEGGRLSPGLGRGHAVQDLREVHGVAGVAPRAHVAAAARRHRQRGAVDVDGDLDDG